MPFQGGNFGGRGGGGRGGGRGRFGNGGGGGRGRRDDQNDPNSEQFRKLFIGGLNYETEDKTLKAHFEQYGEITDCIVMKDPQSNKSRGFGFVTFKQVSEIDEAQNNRTHTIDGKEVETKRAMPRDQSGNSANQQSVTKMFIGGVKDETTEDQMREVFEEFGKIENIELMKDKHTGKSRGFCFITFDDYDSVDKAVLKKYHQLNGKRVEVSKALPKDQSESGGMKGGMNKGGGRFNYDDGNYGGYGSGGGYGGQGFGGGYGGQGWGGAGGGYGDYNQGGSWGNAGGGFGSNYGNNYNAGPMKGNGYNSRGSGPYGGGFGSGGYGGFRR